MKNQMRNRYQVNWTSTTRFRMALPARSGGGGGGGGGGAGGNGGVVMLVTSNLTPTSGVLGTLNEKYTEADCCQRYLRIELYHKHFILNFLKQ